MFSVDTLMTITNDKQIIRALRYNPTQQLESLSTHVLGLIHHDGLIIQGLILICK